MTRSKKIINNNNKNNNPYNSFSPSSSLYSSHNTGLFMADMLLLSKKEWRNRPNVGGAFETFHSTLMTPGFVAASDTRDFYGEINTKQVLQTSEIKQSGDLPALLSLNCLLNGAILFKFSSTCVWRIDGRTDKPSYGDAGMHQEMPFMSHRKVIIEYCSHFV